MSGFEREAHHYLLQSRRFLLVAVSALVAAGGLTFYLFVADRFTFLFYFFLPVCVGAVLAGRIRGLLYAAAAIVLVMAPYPFHGIEFYGRTALTENEALISLGSWGAMLIVSAYLIGFVSEVGGNRLLVLGLGVDAISAVERERKRMALDVHDGVAQTVSTALMQADVLEMLVEEETPAVREQAQELRQTLSGGALEIRTMIGNLRPPSLGPDEFPETVSRMVEEFRDRSGIKTELRLTADLTRSTDSVRICVYRVMQEALTNIEHHAEASRAWIGVSETRGSVFLSIGDDGKGFDLPSATANGHHGVTGMQERVWLLTGRINIDTAPGHGTTIRAYIPRYQT